MGTFSKAANRVGPPQVDPAWQPKAVTILLPPYSWLLGISPSLSLCKFIKAFTSFANFYGALVCSLSGRVAKFVWSTTVAIINSLEAKMKARKKVLSR